MRQTWCGTITASDAVAGITGTLPASLVGNEGPRAPELTVSFLWDSTVNEAGYSGTAYATYGEPGTGQHGSMSQHEMNNILFAAGPAFRSNIRSLIPSGNTDLAPTILRILGLSGYGNMHGRVLEEALSGCSEMKEIDWRTETPRSEVNLGDDIYRQEIQISTVGTTSYVDMGNRAS